MADITIKYHLYCGDNVQTKLNEFSVTEDLESDIQLHGESLCEDLNYELPPAPEESADTASEAWAVDSVDVEEWDYDFENPENFGDLDEYGEYIEACQQYGDAYRLRHEARGSCDMDEYEGEYNEDEDFAREYIERSCCIPSAVEDFIDWGDLTKSVMEEFDSYTDGGCHIFTK